MWRDSADPPEGAVDRWTKDVAVVTTWGNVYKCAYFHGENSGCWQRPSVFQAGEQIDKWTYLPE